MSVHPLPARYASVPVDLAEVILDHVEARHATRTEPLIRLSDVPCARCLAELHIRVPVAECRCWDDYLAERSGATP